MYVSDEIDDTVVPLLDENIQDEHNACCDCTGCFERLCGDLALRFCFSTNSVQRLSDKRKLRSKL